MDGWIDCEWYFSYIDHVAMTRIDLQIPVQSVPITTNVVRSNPAHGEVYSIQHYEIKFVSNLRYDGGFL